MKKFYLLVLVATSMIGCSHFGRERRQNEFHFQKSWARHTVLGEYLGARINHVMAPVLYEDLVIQGNEKDGIVAYKQKSGRRVWSREIQGGVTASAKEMGGVLYVGAGDGFFYALDAKTGATRWSFPIKSEGIGAPFVTADVVYFLTGNNGAYALRAQTGETIWFYSRVDGANITVRGASEPTVAGEYVYMGFSDGYVVALRKDKGTLVWEQKISEGLRFKDVDAKPVLDGENLYVSSYDGSLYCLKASTGSVVWTHEDGGFTPVTIDGAIVYFSTSTGKVLALEKTSGKIVWSRDLAATMAGQPILYRGLVIFGEWGGALRALDMRTGADVTQFVTGRGVTAMPVVNKETGYLYLMTIDANLFALKLNLQDRIGEWPWQQQ